jgi:superfamily II DNA or RNA helicase
MQATLTTHWVPSEPSERAKGSQTLRPYQEAAAAAVLQAIDPFQMGLTRALYTASTGAGKTTIFAELVRRLLEMDPTSRVLILAHRVELIAQAYKRIKDHCGLGEWEIGMEIADQRADPHCRVIVASVQTCMRGSRPHPDWKPTAIICDEAHHAGAPSYKRIASRYGVDDGKCFYIGCTATAKRTDRLSLYAEQTDGTPVILERKGHAPRPATYEESVFQRLVFEYGVLDAVEDGYLVPLCGHAVETDTDLNDVRTRNGDFAEDELAKAVDTDRRTLQGIAAWKEIAADRQTIVFCASVEHAHHAAALWQQAGYKAAAVDGMTDGFTRSEIFRGFQAGRIQVLCNMGIATEGTDLPTCSAIVHLRPTKSWNLYVQMSGRASRVLPGIIDGLEGVDAGERRAAIAASRKPDALIIDLVDLYEKCGDICTAPSILDLPVKLDLQGHSLTEAKKMLTEFEEVKDRVIGECPTTYEALEVRLKQVSLMTGSRARTAQDWKATDAGYRFMRVPPNCRAELYRDGETFRLVVDAFGTRILDKTGKPDADMKAYLDCAAVRAQAAIDQHRASIPKAPRGTLGRLTDKQVKVLTRNGHSRDAVDCMPYGMARNLISRYMEAYRQRMEEGA